MVTPLLSAAVLMLMGGFLIHRMHPKGIMGVIRGERPTPSRTITIVPSVVGEPDPVAWGEQGLMQVGLQAPLRHETSGPLWLALRLRHIAPSPLSVSAGVRGISGAGKVVIRVSCPSGRTVEWTLSESDLAFSLCFPRGDEVVLPFRFLEPGGMQVPQTNTFTVSVALAGVSVGSTAGVAGPFDLETGGIVLTRCWSPDEGAVRRQPDGGDDGLGINPGDISIPVPSGK